jgi:hypothetical protein
VPRVARHATRADVLATLAILVLVGSVVAGRALLRRFAPHPSAAECSTLLEHYAGLVARATSPSAPLVAERKAMARSAFHERGFARCEVDLTRAEVACALQAGNADDLERCLP